MFRKVFISGVLACMFLVGCATTHISSGVQQMGRDTYTVFHGVAPIAGGIGEARRLAYRDAQQTCASQGKMVQVANTYTSRSAVGTETKIELIFRCLAENDPAYQMRPEYKKEPTTVIEDRRN